MNKERTNQRMAATSSLCIACLTTDELFSIFDTHKCDDEEIDAAAAMLKNCFDIEISPESDWQAICGMCILKLRGAYYFKLEVTKNTKEMEQQACLQPEYLEESPSDLELLDKTDDLQNYDIYSELDPETGCLRYVLNENTDCDAEILQHFDLNVEQDRNTIAKSYENVRTEREMIENKDLNMQKVMMIHASANAHYTKVKYVKNISFHSSDKVRNINKLTCAPKPILKHKNTTMSLMSPEINEIHKESKNKPCKAKKSVTFADEKINASKRKFFTLAPGQTECSICKETFHSTKKLYEHMNIHYPNYACEQCGKKYASRQTLKRHMETHLDGPFPCSICDLMFTKLNTRSAHIWRVHQTRNPYLCSACGDRFRTFHQRLKHQQVVHGQTDPKYPCPYCKNKYFYAGSRSQHIRATHLRERQYKCSRCPMSFAKRREVLGHLASVHGIGEKRHQCHVCLKSFYRSTTLRYHLKTHEKASAREHQCTICNAQFSYKEMLRCHMKDHELENVSTSPVDSQDTVVIVEDQIIEGSDNTVYLDFQDI